MSKYVEPMVVDEKGNIYYSAECINGIKDKQQEQIQQLTKELEEEKKAYNRIYNRCVEKDNIINELEKYCIEEIEDYDKKIDFYKANKLNDEFRENYEGEKVCFEDMLEKIKELKGVNKE